MLGHELHHALKVVPARGAEGVGAVPAVQMAANELRTEHHA